MRLAMIFPIEPDETLGFGEHAPELVSVIEPGTQTLGLPGQAASGNDVALDSLLSEALFGEVIDISDLIPRLLSSPTETAAPLALPADTASAAISSFDADAIFSHAEALTILYDDDMQASANGAL